jgi:hypothetical protein
VRKEKREDQLAREKRQVQLDDERRHREADFQREQLLDLQVSLRALIAATARFMDERDEADLHGADPSARATEEHRDALAHCSLLEARIKDDETRQSAEKVRYLLTHPAKQTLAEALLEFTGLNARIGVLLRERY